MILMMNEKLRVVEREFDDDGMHCYCCCCMLCAGLKLLLCCVIDKRWETKETRCGS